MLLPPPLFKSFDSVALGQDFETPTYKMGLPTRIPIYPRATQHRRPEMMATRLHGISGRRFAQAATKNFLLLQLLFLGLFSYMFGALFQQTERIHNLTVGFVDYDVGGAIGSAVRRAYTGSFHERENFPTLIERSVSDFPSPEDLESAVCRTDYWAALYVLPGASGRLSSALSQGEKEGNYDRQSVMAFIWNQARYPTVVDSAIAVNLATLSNAARLAYTNNNSDVASLFANNSVSQSTISILANPWDLVPHNIQPTTQGPRAIYNTVALILIMMQEFFYLGIVNGLHQSFGVYTKLRPSRIVLFRTLNSVAYCLAGSLCVAGAIWAFRAGWDVSGAQFVLTWLTLWLFAHLNFQTLDVFTVWLPHPYVPMALVAWVVLNVASVIVPFELSAAWYRVGYAMPAHGAYQVLVDVWSRGCNPRLQYSLPVMFAWEVAASVGAILGVYRRSHYAALAEELAQKQLEERVDAAVELERRGTHARGGESGARRGEERVEGDDGGDDKAKFEDVRRGGANVADVERVSSCPSSGSGSDDGDVERQRRQELSNAITHEDEQMQLEQRRASRACPSFGPAFSLPFGEQGDDDRN